MLAHRMPFVTLPLFLVLVMAAAAIDLWKGKIPNLLTFGGLALGLGLAAMSGGAVLGQSLMALGLAVLIYLPLYFLQVFGAGDVKLFWALSVVLGVSAFLDLVFVTFLMGGVWALFILIRQKRVKFFASQMQQFFRSVLVPGLEVQWPKLSYESKVPFGTVIFAGYLWVWLLK